MNNRLVNIEKLPSDAWRPRKFILVSTIETADMFCWWQSGWRSFMAFKVHRMHRKSFFKYVTTPAKESKFSDVIFSLLSKILHSIQMLLFFFLHLSQELSTFLILQRLSDNQVWVERWQLGRGKLRVDSHLDLVVCGSFQPPVLTLSFGVRELCKAGLAEGCTVPHLQHAVPHHLREQGGPEVVEHLALLMGVRRPLDQLLEVLLDHGSALRRLHRAFLLAEEWKIRSTVSLLIKTCCRWGYY